MKIAYFVLCLAVLLFSAYTDIKKSIIRRARAQKPAIRQILNEVFYPVLALSLTVPFVAGFWPFMLRLGLVLLLFLVYDGFFGAGDVKLIMMLIMLGSPMKAAVSVLIGTLSMIVYSFIVNPQEAKTCITTGIIAINTHMINSVKGKGPAVDYALFLTAGFIVATIIYGI